ncbi:hypothetical protein MIND_00741700 [Mycena indigotica]|uniref:Transmembrane protein n=1 Tax=Mycena indigotica TaxID=2126181 RepID=A0A8H6SLT1_9AGAR|nr:uncharacterized protein MIND_00741700 [Mycena indigotica]KAF7301761.1 hypothetical protein MIND_00741700 [Mycena indigotica]
MALKSWNLTIPNTSPAFSYHPYSDGLNTAYGFQIAFSTAFNTQPGEMGQGSSAHVTSLNGAGFLLDFYGNAVYVHGSSSASYDVTLDGTAPVAMPPDDTTGVLFAKDNLIEEHHSITFTTRVATVTGQLFNLTDAVISSSDRILPSQLGFDSSDAFFTYSGRWTTNTVTGVPNNTETRPFQQTTDLGASVLFSFTNASAFAVHGSLNFGHGLYSVSVDNSVPQQMNGSTFWLVPDTVLFFQSGLDPDRSHSVNITNLSANGKFTLSSVVVYALAASVDSPPSSPTSGSPPSGPSSPHKTAAFAAIAGTTVGVVVLLSALLCLFYLRARRKRPAAAAVSPFVAQAAPIASDRKGGNRTAPNDHSPSRTPSPDVNHLLELIAQRIDRRPMEADSASPPRYDYNP